MQEMEPFVVKPKAKLHLHWWITAGVAGAFFIWSFDLIPRVQNAATGTVADGTSSGPLSTSRRASVADGSAKFSAASEDFAALDGDWSDIRDGHSPRTSESEDEIDPILSAGRRKSDRPRGDASVKVRADRLGSSGPFSDPQISLASYEAAPSDHSDRTTGNSEVASLASPQADHERETVIPADVADQLHQIDAWLQEDRILDAHAELSNLYWKQPGIRHLFQDRLDQTASLIFTTSDRQFGPPHFVEYGETLESIAKQYDVPWMYLAMLNRVTPEKLQAGQQLKVVRGPFGAVVDLQEFRLTVHAHGWYVNHYAIGTGKDQKTPLGELVVKEKLENPTWYNPDGGIVEPDDPENPLGEYWMGLGDHIGIHGTNDPSTIGRAASRGCIHLGDDDIAEVFGLLSSGSKVLIRR